MAAVQFRSSQCKRHTQRSIVGLLFRLETSDLSPFPQSLSSHSATFLSVSNLFFICFGSICPSKVRRKGRVCASEDNRDKRPSNETDLIS